MFMNILPVIWLITLQLAFIYSQNIHSHQNVPHENPWISDFVLWWSYVRIPIATFVFGTSFLTWFLIYQNRDKIQIKDERNTRKNKKSLKIIYGTQTGLAKYFAEQMKDKLLKTKPDYNCDIIDMKDCEAEEYLPEQCVKDVTCVFIISTYTDGEPPESAAWFCKFLCEASDDFRVQKSMLESMKYTVFGLGNSIYESNYNSVGKNLDVWLKKLSASSIFPVGLGDDNTMRTDKGNVSKDFENWMELFFTKCLTEDSSETVIKEISLKETNVETIKENVVKDESEDEEASISCKDVSKGGDVVDVEDIGTIMGGIETEAAEEEAPSKDRVMVTPLIRKSLEKQGYHLIGSHSGVKICRWTKSMMRGRGGCYKHTFYGIESHR